MMKRIFYPFFALLLISCNLPGADLPQPTPSLDMPLSTQTLTQTPVLPAPTETIAPILPSPTSSPIPCNPYVVDYCITTGNFIFQRPIFPPDTMTIDLTYGYASTQNGKRDAHHGVEFQNAFGTPVHAAGDGVVVFADKDAVTKFSPWTNFYGNVVIIRHADEIYTLYAHLSTILVLPGQQVSIGDEVGKVGQTGGATGSHLHFEVRKGSDYTEYFSTENPELWLVPPTGTGALSITLVTTEERNYERPLVITHYADASDDPLFVYYVSTYAKGFEHNTEDAVLSNLPPGRYKVAFSSPLGLKERIVLVEAGKLTEIIFDLK